MMLPTQTKRGKDPQKSLVRLYKQLPEEQQAMLLEFAEFLASRVPQAPREPSKPVPQPRPEQESVVKAIRRLSATYPMLDKSKMLNQTSSLVAQHVMQGRETKAVIDELEVVFESHYRKLVVEFEERDRESEAKDAQAPAD
jgi:hypothetical protein